ncbi:MAG: collagen-binding protein [Chitinophagaceae bacterium]|nr:collagen-binding protein [Chitinophagaceae bacterium]
MKKSMLLCIVILCAICLNAQQSFKAAIKAGEEKTPLPGATVHIKSLNKTAIADSNGTVIIKNIPAGKHEISFSHVGFEKKILAFEFPLPADTTIEIELDQTREEEGEVVITSTRTSRSISNIPTRVETISGEELEEKGNMKPGDIRMLLNESTGIQTQQTSATSYNSSIRIQGLDGRYTQIIRDGMPLYAGFSGGLSIMQIAPLDLKQVEVIKGSSSTLYGGGAIAGLVNLVSRTPTEKRQLNFMSNGTSAGGLDIAGFYAQRFKKTGISLFASRNSNKAYDPAGIGLTAIPKFDRYSMNPRLFFYFNEKTKLDIGFTTIWENRVGGDLNYIKNGTPGYFEKNKTNRYTMQLSFTHKLNEQSQINFKNSFNHFNRAIQIPNNLFEGSQQSTFTELSYSLNKKKVQWVTGINVVTDQFKEDQQAGIAVRDYSQNTSGGFVQNTWVATSWTTIETGLRGDYVNNYGFNLLPRIAVLFRFNPKLTSRIGGGLGYKAPNVFTEDAERVQFQHVLPINPLSAKTERSVGFNLDINYHTTLFDAVSFSLNHLFFYTQLNKPLVLTPTGSNQLEFINANGAIDTKGMETNLRLIYRDFKLYIGYTYADVNSHFDQVKSWFALTARNRLNQVLVYEKEDKLKIGLEAYYFSPQKLNDGTMGKSYWICGLMSEKLWKHFSLFINFENIFDTRQTKFDTIFTGPISSPTFKDIYAPVDGFVVNGGVKLRL